MRRVTVLVFLVFLAYLGSLFVFLAENMPERSHADPQSIKEFIGSWIRPSKHTGPVPEGMALAATIAAPAVLAYALYVSLAGTVRLREQIARMDAATDIARTATDKANGAACGARVAIRELSGDTLEQRLLAIDDGHGEIKRSLEAIERDHTERMHRMADRAQILTLQITETTERVTAMCDGEGAMARTVDATEELRRILDTKLAENEGEGNLAERLAEAERCMEGYVPRIEALVAVAHKAFVMNANLEALQERLAAIDGDATHHPYELVDGLKTNVEQFENALTASVAGT